jgi:hypothetical protein
VKDGEDLDVLGSDPIDDPVSANDHFADPLVLKLGHYPPERGKSSRRSTAATICPFTSAA